MTGRKIGTGLLERDPQTPGTFTGDVLWFGFPIGVRITREGDAVRCDFFDRPKPDWASIPAIGDPQPQTAATPKEPYHGPYAALDENGRVIATDEPKRARR